MLPSMQSEEMYAFGFPASTDGAWGPLMARFYRDTRTELPNERAFWTSLVRPGERVLEIGAGSGFISSALANGQPSILTLVEPETTNVSLLRTQLENRTPAIRTEIIQGSFENVIVPKHDLVVFPFDSLPMVTNVLTRREIFNKARQCLDVGGRFALHVSTPKFAEAYLAANHSLTTSLIRLPDGTPIEVKRMARRVSPEHYLKFFTIADLSAHVRENYLFLTSVVTSDEVLTHAAATGFRITAQYGDFHRGPSDAASEENVFVFALEESP